MKKFITAVVAVMIIAFSAVPAFALSVNSPVATNPPAVKQDKAPVSPKTGSDSVVAYSVIALSATACGAATLFAVKKAKANK